jgi:tetratricopeptide (TPR) repeat protein
MFRLSKFMPWALFACLALPANGAKHDNWVEVRSPNFVVVCNAGEKQARKTALQFEQIRGVFRQSLAVASNHPSPVITVLAAKDEDTMRELLPEDWAKGHAHPAGLFVYRMNVYFAAVLLGREGSNAYEAFYHEYYHSVTLPYFQNMPLWVSEGLAEFYGHTQIDDKSVGMGHPDADLLAELRKETFIPLNVLFKVDQNSPYYNEARKTSIFYAESWALTHYLMLGDRAAHRAQFVSYLRAVGRGETQEQAAGEAFGDLRKLQADLLSYIGHAAFFYMKVPAVAKVSDNDLKVRELPGAEADAYRGGFAAVRGRSEDAKQILAEAQRLDPNVALVQEYLGISHFFEGASDKALISISKAIQLDPNNTFTRFFRAEIAIRSGGTIPRNPQVEDDLRQAITLSPNFPPPYALLASCLANQDEKLPEALSLAQKAASFEPANSSYQLALAQVLLRMERYDEANLAASRALAWARDPQEKASAETFVTLLRQARQYHSVVAATASQETGSAADESLKGLDLAEGTVTNDRCEDGLKLDLQTGRGPLHLREPLRGNIAISVDGGTIPRFSPCTSLNGLRVEIRYSPDEDKSDTGIIRSMRVLVPNREAESPSGMAVAEGKVSAVQCKGNEMRLTLDAADKSLGFHAADYTKIKYVAGSSSSMGDLEPCSELKGHAAKIAYATFQNKSFVGEIETIIVGK